MTPKGRRLLWLLPAALCAFCGLVLFGMALKFAWSFANAPGEFRGEASEGAIIALLLALPFWALVSAFSFPARHVLSRRAYLAINAPAIFLAAGFVVLNVVIFALAVLGK